MLLARWPAGVDEVVMHRLLHIVNDSLFETLQVVAEQLDAHSRFFCDRFVTRPNGLKEIIADEANHPFYVCL